MSDPVDFLATGGSAGAGFYLAKKTVDAMQFIFGGYAEEAREALRRLGAYQLRNWGRVVENADSKTNHSLSPGGLASPRAAFRVLQESLYAEDAMLVEYLGGVLASTRMADARTADLGNSYAALVSTLAAEHLKLHYVMYRAMQFPMHGRGDNVYDADVVKSFLNVFVPSAVLVETELLDEGHGGLCKILLEEVEPNCGAK